MKKTRLTERFQQLSGIKPLYELDEGGAQNDGTPAAKQISTNDLNEEHRGYASSGKLIKEYGWEIHLLMAELIENKFGHKVEAFVEANKDFRLGPSRAGFYDLLSSLERMKDMLK
tara:strand:- start:44 stop:388 length:345 start_codon:yes stop_codon:yes gene_type:complete